MNHPLNQQEKCDACLNNQHERCSVIVRQTELKCSCSHPSLHQEAWAELEAELEDYGDLHDKYCGVNQEDECTCDMQGMKPFFRKVLTSLHKADCERFRGMLEELVVTALFNNDLEWTRIHEMIKMRAPISPENREYYLKPFAELRTALSKIEEEK